MDQNGSAAVRKRSNWWVWLIGGIVLFCLVLLCCLAAGAGIFLLRRDSNSGLIEPGLPGLPDLPDLPPQLPDLTAIPIPTEFQAWPTELVGWMLIEQADPLFGSASLERGFSPDPFIAPAQAGGVVNTAYLGFDCGFTTTPPTFKFNLKGGASDTFLRIFFVPDDGSDTTLVILTPDQEWLCADDSPYGSGRDPVIDLEFGPSGDYVLWAGTWSESGIVPGTIFVTQSMDVTP